MTGRTRATAAIALIICMAMPAWGQQYLLYAPQPVPSGQKAPSQDGILVREIEIRRGDTLYDLSRKFSGHGMYYPQILLFNSIKNPNMIYSGRTLRVPVTKYAATESERTDKKPSGVTGKTKISEEIKAPAKEETPSPEPQAAGSSPVSSSSTELSLSDLKTSGSGKSIEGRHKRKGAVPAKKKRTRETTAEPGRSSTLPAVVPAADADSGQKLFEAAAKAYKQEDCRAALELLDRYLADNSGSPMAAEANLYKADCYLKLSAQ